MSDTLTPAQKALNDKLTQNLDRILAVEEQIKDAAAKGFGTADLKEQVANMSKDNAKFVDELKAITERIDAGEAAAKKAGAYGPYAAKSAGATFVESDAYTSASNIKDIANGPVIERGAFKAVTVGAGVVAPERLPGIVAPQNVALTMRSLIPGGRSSKNAVEYVKLTARATAAATVAAGGLKPESSLATALATAKMAKMAHWIAVTEEQLSDVDELRSLIDAEMIYGLELVEDTKILNGPGPDGTDVYGIIPQATAYAAAVYGSTVAAAQRLDHIRGMMAQLQVASFAPDGIVLHPTDWFKIETTKTGDNAYIFASATAAAGSRLWGLPVVSTTQMTADNALVGAFRLGAQIYDGQLMGTYGIQIRTGYVNDQLIHNQLTILAEERFALAVKRPGAFVYGDLTPA